MSPDAVTWVAVLAASAVCFATKLVGHRVPEHWLARPRVARVASLVTVALLGALVAVQAFTAGDRVVLDARAVAVAVAAVALALRAPFVVVVVLAAAVAAALRALT
ncbi:MAG: AzlD domain-containing protein [Actinotalea sp.]|nr:AzlD domain-containing protein [Actinotalea sp.]